MAQIIKHRRGSLESISGATKRAGELLVVTGSAGITADNGDSLLFIGVDGSTATAANKVLQGSSTPDLSGASYDTSVDGIPFYNTSTEKLYLLNKGGNVEIKATANTGGTGIVSGSSQITISDTSGYSSFSGSLKATDDAAAGRLSNIESFSSSQETKNSTLASYTSSNDDNITELFSTASNHEGRVVALEAFSSSLGDGFATDAELQALSSSVATSDSAQNGRLSNLEATTASIASAQSAQDIRLNQLSFATASIAGEQLAQDGRLDSIEGFTASIDTTIKTKLNVEAVVSSSAQVNDLIVGTSFSSSVDSRVDALEAAVGAGSNIDGRLTSLEATSASHDDRLDQLEADSGSQALRLNNLESFSSSIETAISVDGQNVTVNGNFTVSGTQTIVDSTTVQIGDNIIELNGSGAANGGLWVKDATAPNTATGSLVWDSTNDYWKAGVKGEEIKVLLADGDSVVSGSSQITIGDTTGFGAFSGSLKATDDAQSARLSALETETGSIATAQGVQDGRLNNLEATTASIESAQGVQDGRLSNLEAETASIQSAQDAQDGRLSNIETYTASLSATFEEKASGTHTLVSGSSQIVSFLDGQDVNLGGISGSSLDITGNAKIDGNIVIGGNITIGDASSDTISFGGEISSDFLPSADNTYDLGSSAAKFAEIHGSNIYGTINGVVNATNGVISGSSQVNADTITNFDSNVKDKLNVEAVVSSSAQVVGHLLNQATDFGSGRVSGDNFGDAAGTSTFTGSFVGDGSGLTGLATNLSIEDGKGNSDTVDLLIDTLSIASGSGLGVDVTVSDNTITISGVNASTAAKGVASFDADDFSVSSGNVSIKSGGVRAANLNSDVAGTGISLNVSDNSIEVDYGSTAGTAVEGDTALTIQGTANEIEISGGSITLGNGGTVTVGLPDSVTIQTGSIVGDLSVGADLTVVGNLFVQGTTTTVDSTTIQLGDNIIELNGSGAANGGLLVKDATAPNTVSGSLLWDSTNDFWKGGALGSEKEFARIDSSLTAGTVLKADANGLLVDTTITDDGTDVSITGDFTIGGLTANSFVVADGSKTLTSVVPSNAGDLIQWNGSSFVASNTVDGGTF